MKKFYTAILIVISLLTLTGFASAQGPVGADCTEPPNLVPFADLINCDLSGREMEGVDLSNADLSGANLDDANLFTTILRDATFDNASLRNTIMEDADAREASFINADMRGVDLYFALVHDADLSGANFTATWINSVDFEGSNLQNAVFTGSDIRRCCWRTHNQAANSAKWDLGVVARGTSLSQSIIRKRLIAAAIPRWCKCVFVIPR